MAKAGRLGVLLVTLGLLGAGLAAQNPPAASTAAPQMATDSPTAPPSGADNSPMAVDANSYQMGNLDVIRIKVWREEQFSDTHVVRPDGKITLPLVGDIQAAGLTPERLSVQLEQALADFMQSPDVTVTVLQVNSKKYMVTGMVLRAGPYAMPTPIRVFEALSIAGFQEPFANKKDIKILRDNGKTILKFNYDDITKSKKLEQNIFLQNGDTIIVK